MLRVDSNRKFIELCHIYQYPYESVYGYIERFINISTRVPNLPLAMERTLFVKGLCTELRIECQPSSKFTNMLVLENYVKNLEHILFRKSKYGVKPQYKKRLNKHKVHFNETQV